MKRITVFIVLLISVFIYSGCGTQQSPQSNIDSIKSYKDIPGVTDEEIAKIEALKEERYRFTYGHLFETESFRLPDGTYAGFTIKFCELLSELFDKEFTAVHYYDWELLKDGIDNLSIDFSSDFATTAEQMKIYYMTSPIAGRTLNIYTLKTADEILSESDVNGMRLGFLTGTSADSIIMESYPDLSFETVEVAKVADAADMLKSGKIDAFVMDEVMDLEFERYDFVRSKSFFALVHTPVSMTTANPELETVISVVNKYLAAGGINKLFELYGEGDQEYTRYKVQQSFTPEEKAYIAALTANGEKVHAGVLTDIYPVSFYNERDKEFQGIVPDIFEEMTALTGIEFEPLDPGIPLANQLAMLKSGEIPMFTQLYYSESRKNDFIWADAPYFTSNYALLSRSDMPDLAMHQVFYVNVGTVAKSTHEEMFYTWFPKHERHYIYATATQAFEALEKGEIDLLMLTESMLLGQTNYREKPGFKVNISFNKTVDSIFGYNKDETILCSILNKAMYYIDTDRLSKTWHNKVYDYSKKIAQMQTMYVSIFALALGGVLVAITLLFLKNRRLGVSLMSAVEEAQAASKIKSQFLANMSHEIRTPMNAIIGMSELLMSEPLSARQESYAKDIHSSSHSLLAIINDILDFSKIEAGKLELTPIDYDFEVFIENIRSMFKYVVQKKGLEFKFETAGDIPKCLFGDDIRLRQVLTNICGNAVKFTESGSICLTVSAANNELSFAIADTGIGIRAEDMSKLFNAFSQADAVKNRSIKGTGLGLAISKSFVEMMGGHIVVTSEYGKGTVFTVKIPAVAGDDSRVRRDDKKDKGFYAPDAKILVVDDNELNLKVAGGLLRLFRIDTDIAASGRKALELVEQKDYDIIFMDHMMPEMDGIETTIAIRAKGGKFEEVPIVALTANAVRGAKEMFLANGFNDFLSKPIETTELVRILTSMLPAEKIVERTADEEEEITEEDRAASEFLDSVKKISGVNTDIGLSRFAGDPDMYRETMELFYKKVQSDCAKLESFLSENEIRNFAILVHGMKSSLSTIGAMDLSSDALELEMAAKGEDVSFCEERTPGFIEKLHELHEKLAAVFPVAAEKDRPQGDAGFLRETITQALAAVDEFDQDTASELLNKLLEYDFGGEKDALLDKAKTAIANFDFDEATDALNEAIAE